MDHAADAGVDEVLPHVTTSQTRDDPNESVRSVLGKDREGRRGGRDGTRSSGRDGCAGLLDRLKRAHADRDAAVIGTEDRHDAPSAVDLPYELGAPDGHAFVTLSQPLVTPAGEDRVLLDLTDVQLTALDQGFDRTCDLLCLLCARRTDPNLPRVLGLSERCAGA